MLGDPQCSLFSFAAPVLSSPWGCAMHCVMGSFVSVWLQLLLVTFVLFLFCQMQGAMEGGVVRIGDQIILEEDYDETYVPSEQGSRCLSS